MKNDNRKIARWITLDNGVHVPIYEGQSEADATKNLEEYMKGKQDKKTYKDILKEEGSIVSATSAFTNKTGISVDNDVLDEVDDESLAQVYDTIAELKDRSDAAVDVILLYNEETVDDCDPNAFAAMGHDGKLYLNSIYFSQKPSDITELFQESVETRFHPACPDGIAGIITHEVGHANFFAWMEGYNRGKGGSDNDYDTAYKWCRNEQIDDFKGALFKEIYNKMNNVSEKVLNNPQIIKEYGRKPNVSLQALASRNFGTPSTRISEYASTNIFELLAEAYADVMWNSGSASLLAKELYNEFYKRFEK